MHVFRDRPLEKGWGDFFLPSACAGIFPMVRPFYISRVSTLNLCVIFFSQAAVITLGVADTNGEMDKLHLKAFDIFYCRNLLYLCKTAN